MIGENRKNDAVVVGTAYPGLGKFLGSYLDSLERQSCDGFDLLIANDGLNGLDALLAARKLFWSKIDVDGSPSSNRRMLIRRALDLGYRKIIFADCDDTLTENRVEVVIAMLDSDSIVVNDLDTTDAEGNFDKALCFSGRFSDGKIISVSSLRMGNMMGLSNTAARKEVFQGCPAMVSGDLAAFDWYLWSSVLLGGYMARFTSKTSSKYRVHFENTAGLPQLLNEESVAKGVSIKLQYYGLMSALDGSYAKLATEFQQLSNKLTNKGWRMEYIAALKEHQIENHIWWENIRTPSEVGLT